MIGRGVRWRTNGGGGRGWASCAGGAWARGVMLLGRFVAAAGWVLGGALCDAARPAATDDTYDPATVGAAFSVKAPPAPSGISGWMNWTGLPITSALVIGTIGESKVLDRFGQPMRWVQDEAEAWHVVDSQGW